MPKEKEISDIKKAYGEKRKKYMACEENLKEISSKQFNFFFGFCIHIINKMTQFC